VVEWSRLAVHPALDRIALPVRRLVGEVATAPAEPPTRAAGAVLTREPSRLSRSNAVVRFGWTMIVAILDVATQRAATVHHLHKGRVVVCDRYTLDSLVHLRSQYGDHRFRLQRLILRSLSPRPKLAFFLDVGPETALRRKPEQFGLDELELQARLYHEESAALGVRRLDGEGVRADLCAEVAQEAWAALAPSPLVRPACASSRTAASS
jgi:hypothetical protein